MQVVLACSLEMYAFPFDKQNCSLTFRSWLHSGLFTAYSGMVEKRIGSELRLVLTLLTFRSNVKQHVFGQ